MAKISRLLLLVLTLFLPLHALAQVPLQVHYQGYLTNSAGAPINATTNIAVRLYDHPTAGNLLFEETHAAVQVANGVFQVTIGSVQPLTLSVFDTARHLSLQAGADAEMSPRLALSAAPFALHAERANQLSGTATVQGSQITGTISGATVPGAVPWVAVGGASQQAASNTAYVVTGAAPTSITLPAAPAVGDVVKLSSQGMGGFTLAPSAGQTIAGGNVAFGLPGYVWTARESERNWRSVASSADGTKLAAVVFGGQIHTSIDSGASWTPRESARNWQSVASSADGAKLAAVVYGGQIYTAAVTTITGAFIRPPSWSTPATANGSS